MTTVQDPKREGEGEREDVSVHVSRVYEIVLTSIVIYTGGILGGLFVGGGLVLLASVVSLGAIISLAFATTTEGKAWSTRVLSVSMGVTSSPMVRMAYLMDPMILIVAVGALATIFMSFTFLARYIKDEQTVVFGGFLMSALLAVLVSGIVMIFVGASAHVDFVYQVIGILVFCGFIAYDTKMMYMRFRDPADERDYYHHAVNIFLDVVNLFLKLVHLLMIIHQKRDTSEQDKKK